MQLFTSIKIHRRDAEIAEAMKINQITGTIIKSAIEVHRVLGPGLLESAYEECLCRELNSQQIPFQRQRSLPLEYKGFRLDCGFDWTCWSLRRLW